MSHHPINPNYSQPITPLMHGSGSAARRLGPAPHDLFAQSLQISHLQSPDPIVIERLVIERTHLLAKLNAYTVERIERERKALAAEIHDELGATLTLMSLELHSAFKSAEAKTPEALLQSLQRLKQLVDAMSQYKHRLIAGLRPPLLQELGLRAVLQNYVRDFGARTHLAICLNLPDMLPNLKEAAALAVFRAVQESLTNAVKYAQATCLVIEVQVLEAALKVIVEDNGSGIQAARAGLELTEGYGLLSMRERIQLLGGTTLIECCTHEGGTRITIQLPLVGNVGEVAAL